MAITFATKQYQRCNPNAGARARRSRGEHNLSRLGKSGKEDSLVHSFRVTDVHFHLVMLMALFLAVPHLSWRRRLENLG
jgi:hypothetical protein